MAAITMGADIRPALDGGSSLGTTWQQVNLPPWTGKVTIEGSEAFLVAWESSASGSPTQPAHGGASGSTTYKVRVPAGAHYELTIRDNRAPARNAEPIDAIYVAAQSGTVTSWSVVAEAAT